MTKEELRKSLDFVNEERERLQKENERLKEKINEVVNKQQLVEEKFNYKSRIEKAIEYIEHNTFQDSDGGWIFTFYKGKEILLDILNGRSDE